MNHASPISPKSTSLISPSWLLCFVATSLIFVGFSTGKLGSTDIPLLALALILASLFTSRPKLKIEVDLLASLFLVAVVGIAASSMSKRPEISFLRLELYRDVIFLGFGYYVLLRRGLVTNVSAVYLGVILGFLCVTPQTLSEYFSYSAQAEMSGRRYIAPELSHYGHIRHFSYHAFFAACCATHLTILEPRFRTFSIALVLVCVAALVLSTGRAAILAYLVLVVLLLRRELPPFKIIGILVLLTLAAAAALFILSFTPAASLTESIILRSQQLTNPDQLLSGRIGIWKNALESARESPLLGLGPEGYRWSQSVPLGVRQPHSAAVQLAVEFGFLGGTVIVATLLRLIVPRIRNFSAADSLTINLYSGLSALLIATLVYSLVDGVFYHRLPLIHVAVLSAVWFAAVTKTNN